MVRLRSPLQGWKQKLAAMNYAYLLAMIGHRLVALAGIVILSFLLDPAAFGLYTLSATNALLTEIVFGQWIAISANKHISIGSGDSGRATISTLGAAMGGYAALMVVLWLAYVIFPIAHATPGQVAIVLAWSTTLVLYDVTLASKNALGASGAYAALALVKNFGSSALSISLVLLGYGVTGAMAGQIIGTLAAVALLKSSVRIWRGIRLSLASRSLALEMLKFGVGGTLALGVYMLFNAIGRNLTGHFLGETEAGYLSLATDLFFGPLTLVGSAYSLSKMPSLYVVEADGDRAQKQAGITDFIYMNLYFAIPYAVGGAILAPDIAASFLPAANRAQIAAVSAGAAVQSAAMLMMCTVTAILLIFNLRRYLIVATLGTSALNGILLGVAFSLGSSLWQAVWLSTLVLWSAVLLLIFLMVGRRLMRLEAGTILKITLAAAAMGGAAWACNRLLLLGQPFGAVIAGLIVYFALTKWMGVTYIQELVPKRRVKRVDIAATPGQFE